MYEIDRANLNLCSEDDDLVEEVELINLEHECHENFIENCNQIKIHYDMYTEGFTKDNSTEIRLIPKYTTNIIYEERPKFNTWGKIYICSGIICLWLKFSIKSTLIMLMFYTHVFFKILEKSMVFKIFGKFVHRLFLKMFKTISKNILFFTDAIIRLFNVEN